MKTLLTIFVLFFSSSLVAKNYTFEIEGMSLGDSLLDYMSKNEINKNTVDFYDYIPNNIWLSVAYQSKLLQNYELLQITIKKNDSKFTIYAIGGIISDIGIEECYKTHERVDAKINEELNNPYKEGPRTLIHPADPSGMSQVYQITYEGDNGSVINNECYDWSKNVSYLDSFSVHYLTKEFNDFLNVALK
jgi:hypothetical protein